LGGLFARAERLADFAKRFVFEKPRDHSGSISLAETVHRFVEQWFYLGPGGGGVHRVDLLRDLFTELPRGFSPDGVDSPASRDLIKPGRHNGLRGQPVRLACELDEGRLRNLLRQRGRSDLAERGGVDQVHVPSDDFTESILRPPAHVAGE